MSLLAAGCGSASPSPVASGESLPSASPSEPAPTAGIGEVVPAPGSSSSVYAPNPGAIVVAIEAGHGGCLDWGVPDPRERGPEFAEKAITLAIAERMASALEAQGIVPVLLRDADEALAGDDYPALDCHGPPFRDVNGDGVAGFGADLPEGTRTRDELQARLDVANLVGADALVSIHVDSITDADGTPLPIARTETFYTDETPWGVEVTEPMAAEVQSRVLAALDELAPYERQDRGINARNLYMVAPPLFEPTDERPDRRRQPTRGALMPAILVEVGSITLSAEHDLLLSDPGQEAVAAALVDGLAAYLATRTLAVRIEPADTVRGARPPALDGDGPPFWPAPAVPADVGSIVERLRVINTGTQPWPDGLHLVAGSEATEAPYLPAPPEDLRPTGPPIPALAPGEAVELTVVLPVPDATGRHVLWITLDAGGRTLADRGSAPLQLAVEP